MTATGLRPFSMGRKVQLKVFISHISEEALFALLLKDFIESTFMGQCEVSLSSNAGDDKASEKWLAELDGIFEAAELFLVLCSPKSMLQPWVHFEFGSAWTKQVPINCICHSGLSMSDLPPHLRRFKAFEVDDNRFMEELINALAKLLGIDRLPRLSYETMNAEMRATLASISPDVYSEDVVAAVEVEEGEPKEVDTPKGEEPKEEKKAQPEPAPQVEEKKKAEKEREPKPPKPELKPKPPKPKPKPKPPKPKPKPKPPPKAVVVKKKPDKKTPAEPESVQKRILSMLAAGGVTGYALDDLSDLLGIVPPKLEPYLDALKVQGYIDISYGAGGPPEYSIAPEGEKFLKESRPA